MLSAKTEDTDKILGLNVGADDYVSKPFNPLELIARVKSNLRRYTKLGNMSAPEESNVYRIGGLCMDDDTKEVTVDGEPVRLTPIEYSILLLLVKIRAESIPLTRFMRISGTRRLSVRTIRWRCISGISGRKLKSTPRSRSI